jgi:hypothetical protein
VAAERGPETILVDVSNLRIVEIGTSHMAAAFPDQTRSFCPLPVDSAARHTKLSLANIPHIYRAVRDPDLSLIVCRPGFFAPWQGSLLVRALFDRRAWQGYPRFGPAIAPHLLRLPVTAPIAVIDTEDTPFIERIDFHLLSRCRFYFKRELPTDRWRLFTKTAHRGLPTPRFRRRSHLRGLLDKLRPISLGLPAAAASLPAFSPEKSSDVFFAGDVAGSSTLRPAGLSELIALRERGLRVDLPEGRLPPAEFYRRCASAWITWSPEGLGWDCFRHYEALACGSVPLISRPTIERYRPLIEGVHAFYYDPEPGNLAAAVEGALADKDRLRTIAHDGRAYVLAHHTTAAIARYVLESTLAAG